VSGLRADLRLDRGEFSVEVQLEAPAGVSALLGPNGSGKTTVLLALAGLLRADRADVEVGGRAWSGPGVDLPPERRSVGLVLADPVLFGHLSLLDNVAFGPRSRGMPRRTARERAQEELERVGLGDLVSRRPGQVSSGQAQRAALARALATDPEVLLLDEPLSALDPQTRSRTRSDLATRLRDYPGVTLLTTHDPLDALTLADRLLFLEDGRITQTGTPGEVVARPRTAYVASLVGLNLLRGTLTHDGPDAPGAGATDESTLPGGGWTLTLAGTREGAGAARLVLADPPDGAAAGEEVWASINPEAVALFTQRPQTSARNLWRLRVDSVTVTGQRTRVHLVGEVALVAEITLGAVADLDIQQGRELWAAVKATEIYAYPA